MYAQLGTIIFEGLKGFDSFETVKEAIYAEHALIEGKPRLQRNGSALDKISLTFVLHARFSNVEADISALETYVENGDVVPFVLGNGVVVGDFVILRAKKNFSQTDGFGNIISSTLEIELLEFVEPNKLGTKDRNAKDAGFAKEQNTPTPAPVFTGTQDKAVDVSNAMQAVSIEGTRTDTDLKSGVKNGAERQRKFASALESMKRMEGKITILNTKLNSLVSEPLTVDSIKQDAERVLLAIEATKSYTEVNDIPSLISSNQDLQNAIRKMRSSGTRIDSAVAVRRQLV